MDTFNRPSHDSTVRFEWILESWRLFSSASAIWIASLTIVGVVNLATFLLAISAFGVEARIKDAIGSFIGGIGSGDLNSSGSLGQDTVGSVSTGAIGTSVDVVIKQIAAISGSFGFWLTVLTTTLVAAFMYAGLQRMANAQMRGESISVDNIFGGASIFGNYAAYSLIASVPYFLTFALWQSFVAGVLLSVLGVFVYVITLPGYAMIADGASAFVALRSSVKAVLPHLGKALLLYATFCAILCISAIPCLFGLVITTPMITIIYSLAYRDMIMSPAS